MPVTHWIVGHRAARAVAFAITVLLLSSAPSGVTYSAATLSEVQQSTTLGLFLGFGGTEILPAMRPSSSGFAAIGVDMAAGSLAAPSLNTFVTNKPLVRGIGLSITKTNVETHGARASNSREMAGATIDLLTIPATSPLCGRYSAQDTQEAKHA